MCIVSIVGCSDYEMVNISAALAATFDNLGGIRKYVNRG